MSESSDASFPEIPAAVRRLCARFSGRYRDPYIATLLVDHDLHTHPLARVTAFDFRAQQPIFDSTTFDLCFGETTQGANLWPVTSDGHVAMTAEIIAIAR